MTAFQGVITLVGEERGDGSVYIHSPDVPLFHVVAPQSDDWLDWVEPILKDHLELNTGGSVKLKRVPSWAETFGTEPPIHLPAHILAEMAHT